MEESIAKRFAKVGILAVTVTAVVCYFVNYILTEFFSYWVVLETGQYGFLMLVIGVVVGSASFIGFSVKFGLADDKF